MELADLRPWYERLQAELDASRFAVGWVGPTDDRATRSARLSVDGPARLAELIVWETGEAQLQVGDVASGAVTDERLRLVDSGQVAQAVARMKAWVTEN